MANIPTTKIATSDDLSLCDGLPLFPIGGSDLTFRDGVGDSKRLFDFRKTLAGTTGVVRGTFSYFFSALRLWPILLVASSSDSAPALAFFLGVTTRWRNRLKLCLSPFNFILSASQISRFQTHEFPLHYSPAHLAEGPVPNAALNVIMIAACYSLSHFDLIKRFQKNKCIFQAVKPQMCEDDCLL